MGTARPIDLSDTERETLADALTVYRLHAYHESELRIPPPQRLSCADLNALRDALLDGVRR